MNIGQAAKLSGLSPRMIRHYESLGVLREPARRVSGYRDYGPQDLDRLRFIRNARDLRFSIAEIGRLLELWSSGACAAPDIEAMVTARLRSLQQQERDLQASRALLQRVLEEGSRHPQPGCGIVGLLAGAPVAEPKAA